LRAPAGEGHAAVDDVDDLGLDGGEEPGELIGEHAERGGVLVSPSRRRNRHSEGGDGDRQREEQAQPPHDAAL
jgi:hypothetical protein